MMRRLCPLIAIVGFLALWMLLGLGELHSGLSRSERGQARLRAGQQGSIVHASSESEYSVHPHETELSLDITWSVSGRVTDQGGNPAIGVDVFACPQDDCSVPICPSSISGDDGFYTIIDLPECTYQITTPLIVSGPPLVTVPPDATGVDLVVEGNSSSIRGKITDELGSPIPDATIWVWHDTHPVPHAVTTGADGTYVLDDLISGIYSLVPSRAGYTFSPPIRIVLVPPSVAGQDFVGTSNKFRRLLFVPLRWDGTQSAFDEEARSQVNAFLDEVPLGACREQVDIVTLDVDSQNFEDWTCSAEDCGVDAVKRFVRNDLGIELTHYDTIIGLAEESACPTVAAGCSNGSDTIWFTPKDDLVLAHELGHIFGLADQYCSHRDGMSSDTRCNDGDSQGDGAVTGDVNWLDAEGTCDCPPDGSPDSEGQPCCNFSVRCYELDGCFWRGTLLANFLGLYEYRCSDHDWAEFGIQHVNYGPCCWGNKTAGGGRSIMSFVSDDHAHFDVHDLDYLNTFSALQCDSEVTTTGDEAMQLMGDDSTMIVEVDLVIHSDDSVDENRLSVTYGRPTLASIFEGTSGDYALRIRDASGAVVWSQDFAVYFDYSGPVLLGVDYSGISYDAVNVSYRIPYASWMYIIDLYHGETLIYSEQLPAIYEVYLPLIVRAY